jgi:hypothetical protein
MVKGVRDWYGNFRVSTRGGHVDRTRRPCLRDWFSCPAIAASPESLILSDSARFKELIIKLLVAGDPRVTRWSFRQKGRLQIALQYRCLVQCCTQIILVLILQRLTCGLTRAWILNICRLSSGIFLNLGPTCFRTEWRARVNFRRLLLRDSPSSQPPRLPKFNFGTASPTRCTNYSVLQTSGSKMV